MSYFGNKSGNTLTEFYTKRFNLLTFFVLIAQFCNYRIDREILS